MGYRKIPTIYTLKFDQYEGLEVRMKSMKIGKMRAVLNVIEDDDLGTPVLIDEMVKVISEGLVSWNLEDEDGKPLEPVRSEVEELEFGMLNAILDKWLGELSGPDQELGKGSPSGVTFPVEPITMETL